LISFDKKLFEKRPFGERLAVGNDPGRQAMGGHVSDKGWQLGKERWLTSGQDDPIAAPRNEIIHQGLELFKGGRAAARRIGAEAAVLVALPGHLDIAEIGHVFLVLYRLTDSGRCICFFSESIVRLWQFSGL